MYSLILVNTSFFVKNTHKLRPFISKIVKSTKTLLTKSLFNANLTSEDRHQMSDVKTKKENK